jgi:hypothetical protein
MYDAPDIKELTGYNLELSNCKDRLMRKKYELNKYVAKCLKEASSSGKKMKELEAVKIMGNTPEDEQKIDSLQEESFSLEKRINELKGMLDAWEANKDLFISESYYISKGLTSIRNNEET